MYQINSILFVKILILIFVGYGIASSHQLSLILNAILLLFGVIGWIKNKE